MHGFPSLLLILWLATRLAPRRLDLSAEQGLQGGGGGQGDQGKGGGGNDEGEHELLHLPLCQVDCDIEAGYSNTYSRFRLTGGEQW